MPGKVESCSCNLNMYLVSIRSDLSLYCEEAPPSLRLPVTQPVREAAAGAQWSCLRRLNAGYHHAEVSMFRSAPLRLVNAVWR